MPLQPEPEVSCGQHREWMLHDGQVEFRPLVLFDERLFPRKVSDGNGGGAGLNFTVIRRLVAGPVCWYLRRFRWSPGRWRLLKPMMSFVRTAFPKPGFQVTVRLACGCSISIDPADFMGPQIYVCGEYEAGTTQLVSKIIRPGDHVLDLGANVGYFTLMMGCLVGPRRHSARVRSFSRVLTSSYRKM